MEYLDLTTAEEGRRTASALCAILGRTFREEAILTALVPVMFIAQPVESSNVDQKVGGKPAVEDKNKSLTYKIQESANELVISCREKIESNNPAPTIGDADKVSNSSIVSSCEQTIKEVTPGRPRQQRLTILKRIKGYK